MRISELAERVGVEVTTVRYYERIGLLAPPARTPSGYRDYGEDDAGRLLFVARARRMGLSCDQITDLLPVWDGTNCAAAHERIAQLVDEKRAEVASRIADLRRFARQLDDLQAELASAAPPASCAPDLSCCVPAADVAPVAVELTPKRRS